MFKNLKKKGQSTLEYMVLVAMVIGILILFLKPGGPMATSYNKVLHEGTSGMETFANALSKSHANAAPETP